MKANAKPHQIALTTQHFDTPVESRVSTVRGDLKSECDFMYLRKDAICQQGGDACW